MKRTQTLNGYINTLAGLCVAILLHCSSRCMAQSIDNSDFQKKDLATVENQVDATDKIEYEDFRKFLKSAHGEALGRYDKYEFRNMFSELANGEMEGTAAFKENDFISKNFTALPQAKQLILDIVEFEVQIRSIVNCFEKQRLHLDELPKGKLAEKEAKDAGYSNRIRNYTKDCAKRNLKLRMERNQKIELLLKGATRSRLEVIAGLEKLKKDPAQ